MTQRYHWYDHKWLRWLHGERRPAAPPGAAAHRPGVLGDRALTTAQLAAELGDIPAGSLYRHVAMLTKAGVLQVVAERRVRAVVERTFMLRASAAQIQPDEVVAMTPDQHLQARAAAGGWSTRCSSRHRAGLGLSHVVSLGGSPW